MGWWSKDIMGGDSPLDFEDEIYEICGVDKFPEDHDGIIELSKSVIETNLVEILEMLPEDDEIGFQVLGVLMMKSGAVMNDTLKALILFNSKHDEWAKQDSERQEIIDSFCKAIESYDGTPIVITSKGLFEVIAQHLEDGKEGLVNL